MITRLNKIKIAVLSLLSVNAYGEVIPYTLSIEGSSKKVEAIVVVEGEQYFIPVDDVKNLNSGIQATPFKIDGIEYYKADHLGDFVVNNNNYSANIVLKPEFMPKQEFNLYGLKYKNLPEKDGFSILANYSLGYDTRLKSPLVSFSPRVYINGDFFNSSFNYNKNSGFRVYDFNYNIRSSDNKNITTLGTNISRAGSLNNPVSFVGVQYQKTRDFELYDLSKEYFSFDGTAEQQGFAELFVNGRKLLQQEIKKGDYSFNGIQNTLTGNGTASIVIKDLNGNITTTTQQVLGTPRNLAQGFSDYSFSAGYLRPNVDELSDFFVSGYYAYGLTSTLSLTGYLEATARTQNASISATYASPIGTFTGGFSAGDGQAYSLGYFYRSKNLQLSLDYKQRKNYRGIASNNFTNSKQLTAFGSYKFSNTKYLNFSYISFDDFKQYSIGTSTRIFDKAFLNLNLNQSSDKGFGAYVGLSIPLGKSSVSANYDSFSEIFSANLNNSSSSLNELNYGAGYSSGKSGQSYEGNLDYRTSSGDLNANVFSNPNNSRAMASYSGSMVYYKGFNLARTINSSYAIIDAKKEDISVNSNYGRLGKTNSNGVLIVPTMPLYENSVSIDVNDYQDTVTPSKTDFKFSVFPNSKAILDVELILAGFYVALDTNADFIVIDGKEFYKTNDGFYIDGLKEGEYSFDVDGKKYSFNSSGVKEFEIINPKLLTF